MINRLFQYWVYATPPIALLLIGLYPFLEESIALPLFLSLPVYMIHQYEEHDDNQFADFLNGLMGAEKKGLSPAHVWIINVVFVWFLLLATFYLTELSSNLGVLAAYLLAINGFVHVAWAVAFRRYNPGLWTSLILFLPLAVWIFAAIPASLAIHATSAILIVILHAAIMIIARRPA
ncbi:MAG: HXXEE domain-containing protein [Verrucomicrobiota bacterium]